MPTTFPDTFYVIDPYAPPPSGTPLTAEVFDVTDNNDNGLINRFSNDSIDGVDIIASYPGDTVTVSLSDGSTATYSGVTFYLADGREVFSPTDGQTLEDGVLVSTTFVTGQGSVTPEELEPPCFTPGTRIQTPVGALPIEYLSVGDLVQTLDRGAQPIRWIGRSTVAAITRFQPVTIDAGALGNTRRMTVSPQHRFLLNGWDVELHFGEPEVLVPACHLVNGGTITQQPRRQIEYIHLMFDHHEIVFSDCVPTESFHPGSHIMAENNAIKSELLALFPELGLSAGLPQSTARMALKAREARVLARARTLPLARVA